MRQRTSSYDGAADHMSSDTIPKSTRTSPLVYFNSGVESPLELVVWNQGQLLARFMDAGLRLEAPDFHLTWGSRDDIAADILSDVLAPAGRTGTPVLAGFSHGGLCALHYAAHHPEAVACVVAIMPCVSLTYAYDTDLLGHRPNIEAAWGVTYPEPLPAGSDPATMLDALDGIPIRMYVSSTDNVSTGWEAYDALDSVEVIDAGDGGHGEATFQAIDYAGLVAWIRSHADPD